MKDPTETWDFFYLVKKKKHLIIPPILFQDKLHQQKIIFIKKPFRISEGFFILKKLELHHSAHSTAHSTHIRHRRFLFFNVA